ncbi:MAG: hypothetical protein R3Y56_06485 [Akkermansia sp.]
MSSTIPKQAPKKGTSLASFSDWLPPALILDMRQSLRSPLNIALAILGVLLIYSTITSTPESEAKILMLSFLHSILLLAFIPFRAGVKIARDIRERGSNFLQLCPLSAGRIVWGQFLSCTVQMLLLTLPIIPLYLMSIAPLQADLSTINSDLPYYLSHCPYGLYVLLGVILAGGMLLTALMMALAILPLMARIFIQTGIIIFVALSYIGMMVGLSYAHLRADIAPISVDITRFTTDYLALVAQALAFSGMLLILASRHYSSDIEASSGRLRILSFATLAGAFAWLKYSNYTPLPEGIGGLYFIPLLAIAMLDELQPDESHSGITARRRGFIGYLTRRTTGANIIFVLLMAIFTTAAAWFIIHQPDITQLSERVATPDFLNELMRLATPILALIYSCYATLILTDIVLPHSSRQRLIAFVISAVLIYIACGQLVDMSYAPFHCCLLDIDQMNADTLTATFLWMAGGCVGSFILLSFVQTVGRTRR